MAQPEVQTVASVLEREGQLSPERALALMKEAARAVADAHAAGILHGDLQPATLLLAPDGRVMLAESPLVRRLGEPPPPRDDDAAVSPLYYPPEAARARPLDARADLFQLGGTFYHMLAGRAPFYGPNPEACALHYIRRDVPAIGEAVPGIPVFISMIVHKLLRRDPAERYQSAAELLEVIERTERMMQKRQAERRTAAAGAAASAPPEAAPARRPGTRRLRPAEAADEAAPQPRPTTARARAAATPFWHTKPFIFCAAASGCLLILIVALLLSGRGEDLPVPQVDPVVPHVSATTAAPAKPPEPKVVTPKVTPRVEPPKPKPLPTKDTTIRIDPVLKPTDGPKTTTKWGVAKGTMSPEEEKEYRKKLEELELVSVEDYIVKWEYAGPYRQDGNRSREGPLDVAFPPEKELTDPQSLAPGEAPNWKPLPRPTDRTKPWRLDFENMEGIKGEYCALYIRTRIWSPKTQEVKLKTGSDDSVKIWLNRRLVHLNKTARALKQDEDTKEVTLNEGWNDVLVKIGQGMGQFAYCLRFRSLDGKRLDGLKADPAGK